MNAHDPGPLPEVATRCQHCDKKEGVFLPPVPVIGQPTDAAYFELMSRMCAHLQHRHQKVFHEALGRQMPAQVRFSHLFYVGEFRSNDPEFHKYIDVTRHSLLRMHQRRVSDQKLIERVNSLSGLDGEGWVDRDGNPMTDLVRRSDVLALFREMRDVLQEDSLYPEFHQAEPSRVVLATRTGRESTR